MFRPERRTGAARTIVRTFGLAVTIAAAFAMTGCAGGSGGPVAPVSGGATPTGITSVDAVQHAIGGDWSDPNDLPHSACAMPGEAAPGTGMQNIAMTQSEAPRSESDARHAADLAAAALAEAGSTPADVMQADGIATLTAENADGSSIVVTIEPDVATLEYRSECITGSETV